jgi:hypothetical protein
MVNVPAALTPGKEKLYPLNKRIGLGAVWTDALWVLLRGGVRSPASPGGNVVIITELPRITRRVPALYRHAYV